jgi:predicted RNA-binding protein with RPS1 domain
MTDQNRVGEAVAEKTQEQLLRAAETPVDHDADDTQPEEQSGVVHDASTTPDEPNDQAPSSPSEPIGVELAAEEEEEPAASSPSPIADTDQEADDEADATTSTGTVEASPTEAEAQTAPGAETDVAPMPTEPAPQSPAESALVREELEAAADESAEEVEQEAEPAAEEAEQVSETTEPTAEATTEAAATAEAPAEAETTESAGASFTPVSDSGDSRPRRLKDLEVGMELEGNVTSIALYGVFVDIGVGRDGLVHISEMSDTRINSPSDLVQIGDTVNVRVKSLDLDARRISLTMRSQREEDDRRGGGGSRKRPEVDRERLATLNVGDMVEGTITGLSSFGAFVDIGVGKDGLVHISELSEGRIDKPGDAVQVGETHNFKLLEVDPEGSRISLSLRRAQRLQKMRDLSPGQTIEGSVSGLAAFGAFVDIGVGRDGLVHISQLSDQHVEKVEDVVSVGDSVSVRVLEVDPQSKRISLTMRSEQPADYEEEQGAEETSTPEVRISTDAYAEAAARLEERENERREEGQARRRGGGRSSQRPSNQPATTEMYTTGSDASDEEEFSGNATLEDLVSKFGGKRRKDKDRRRSDTEEEEDEEDFGQRQRDIIRRTLRRGKEDEA